MGRMMSRISHDELVRMIKAAQKCGLPIARVTFDGNRLDVIIGESGDIEGVAVDRSADDDRPAEVETI